ncbi:RecQ family zinc-binding domain-containing protein [Paenarthrobacter sp. Z7-10]|uniref:RecQ family zinc-binding domain-containing protein n=1 Tax=Paenarthrobacter sp. Z7-10 TaxID=2787635 RepID=UPI002E7A8033|nr:RecQ family zinc-binding domain-containing protein [Paenarthrobacter sp. Z7-10]
MKLRHPLVIAQGLDRSNLFLRVRRFHAEGQKHDAVLDEILELDKPGLLYVATREDTESYATELRDGVLRGVEAAESRIRIDRSRLEMMRGYAETDGCRRQYLLGYFGDELENPCGNCDTCRARTDVDLTDDDLTDDDDAFPLQSAVLHRDWGPGIVMSKEDGRTTVLFDREGYKTLSLEAVAGAKVLRRARGGDRSLPAG